MSAINNVLSRLEVRRGKSSQWMARCLAHADKGPSLSVRETPEGAILLHCFAGCEVSEIVAAMGLELCDLYPPKDRPQGAPRKIANLLTATQALALLTSEINFCAIAMTNHQRGIELLPSDTERLRLAAGRINLLKDQTGRQYA